MNDGPLTQAIRNADAAADRFLEGKHIPGVVYGVVAGGELVHVRGLGTLRVGEDAPPDVDSVFRIASMTKSFTAATILSLRDDGHLRLDDPVAAFVPDLADRRGPTTDSPMITIRHLLTMAAGFPTDDPWGDRQQALDLERFAALLRDGPWQTWAPGTRFEYSNLGYGILGRVITAAAGREYRDVVRERILEPLGMTATTFDLDDVPAARAARGYVWRDDVYVEEPIDGYGALASMGGVFTSVRDLSRWVGGFTDAFPPRNDADEGHPLSRSSRREMQQLQATIPPTVDAGAPDAAPVVTASGYGFGLFVTDDLRLGRIVSHSGGYPGFGSNMRWQTASGLGVIALANHRYAPMSLLGAELLTALAETGAVAPRRIQPAPALIDARTAVERLIAAWDDDLAARTFAMNVQLDEPLDRRRAELERLRATHGPLAPDPEEPTESDGPAAMSWWLRGERGGRVRIAISLSPEPEPKVQTLTVGVVPEPDAPTRSVAQWVVDRINGAGPDLPDLPLAAALDHVAIGRAIDATAARYGTVRLGLPIGRRDGSTTFRVIGERGRLTLRVAVDPGRGTVSALELRSEAVGPPPYAD